MAEWSKNLNVLDRCILYLFLALAWITAAFTSISNLPSWLNTLLVTVVLAGTPFLAVFLFLRIRLELRPNGNSH